MQGPSLLLQGSHAQPYTCNGLLSARAPSAGITSTNKINESHCSQNDAAGVREHAPKLRPRE